ncbi:MAG: YncE family protein, partial [Chloroflexota bacterium]
GRPPLPRTPPRAAALVVALDGVTGSIVGTAQVGSHGNGIAVDAGLDHLFVASGGGGGCMNKRCYTDPSILTMLDARTLKTLAVTPVGNSPQDDLLVDDRNGRVYVSTTAGIDVLDARTAKRLSRIHLAGKVLAVDDPANRVFLADNTGDLLLLDGRTSQVLAVLPISLTFGFALPGATFAVDQRTGHLLYAAAQGRGQHGGPSGPVRLYEADGVTGHVLHRCLITAHPTAVAPAPQRGLVIVADSGTDTATVIRMADCGAMLRVHVTPTPSNIAVDEPNNLMAIESNTPRPPTRASGGSFPSTNTTLTIETP